jgi:hypothetical protein
MRFELREMLVTADRIIVRDGANPERVCFPASAWRQWCPRVQL